MSENIFANGFIVKHPHENAPDFVKGSVSVKVDEAIAFLNEHKDERGWVNLDLKESKDKAKLYLQKNTWKPEKKEETATHDDPSSVPF